MHRTMPFRIADWRVEPGSRTITDGVRKRRLSPRALESLLMLVRADGEVVTRQELLDTVWHGVTVGEESVTTAIAEIRRCFSNRDLIETIPRTGYRMAAKSEVSLAPAPASGGRVDADCEFSLEAYLQCVEARRLSRFGDWHDIHRAGEIMEEATRMAPHCAATRAEYTLVLAFRALFCAGDAAACDQAVALADEAVNHRPGLATNHLALGLALTTRHDGRGARRAFEKALALDPNNGEAWYLCSLMFAAFGACRSASLAAERCTVLQPDDYRSFILAASFRNAMGDTELGQSMGRAGAMRLALRLAENPEEPRGRAAECALLALCGQGDGAFQSITARSRDRSALQFYAVTALTTLGETRHALDELERLVDEGHRNAGWLCFNPTIAPLRHERRYQRLMRNLRFD